MSLFLRSFLLTAVLAATALADGVENSGEGPPLPGPPVPTDSALSLPEPPPDTSPLHTEVWKLTSGQTFREKIALPDLPFFKQPVFKKRPLPIVAFPLVGQVNLESLLPDAIKNRTVAEAILDQIASHEETTIPLLTAPVEAGKFTGPTVYRSGSSPQGNFWGVSYKLSGKIVHDILINEASPQQRQVDLDLIIEVSLDPAFFGTEEKTTATIQVNKRIITGTGVKEAAGE